MPYYWRNDWVGDEQESRFEEGGKVYVKPAMLREHTEFAQMWDTNLKDQKFPEALARHLASPPPEDRPEPWEPTTLAQAVAYWNMKESEDHPRPPVDAAVCLQLRKLDFVPNKRTRIYGFDAEFISFPFPSRFGASIMVRQPDDPDTAIECAMNSSAIEWVTPRQ